MKKFDLENIGKGMPYKAPSEEFFANFQSEMMVRAAEEQAHTKNRGSAMRLIIPALAAAASLAMGIFVVDRFDVSMDEGDVDYCVSESLDTTMDSYFDSLSDDQLAYLLDNTSSQDDFYTTLPEN